MPPKTYIYTECQSIFFPATRNSPCGGAETTTNWTSCELCRQPMSVGSLSFQLAANLTNLSRYVFRGSPPLPSCISESVSGWAVVVLSCCQVMSDFIWIKKNNPAIPRQLWLFGVVCEWLGWVGSFPSMAHSGYRKCCLLIILNSCANSNLKVLKTTLNNSYRLLQTLK